MPEIKSQIIDFYDPQYFYVHWDAAGWKFVQSARKIVSGGFRRQGIDFRGQSFKFPTTSSSNGSHCANFDPYSQQFAIETTFFRNYVKFYPWKTSFQENWPLDPENGKRPNVDNSTLFLLRLYISERNFSAFHFPLVVWEKKMFLLFPISITHFLVSPQKYFEWDLSIFLLFAFCVQLQYQMSKLRADKQYFCVSCYFLGFQKVYEYISLWNSAWSSATVPLKKCQYLMSVTYF